jgi:hypothetical protein
VLQSGVAMATFPTDALCKATSAFVRSELYLGALSTRLLLSDLVALWHWLTKLARAAQDILFLPSVFGHFFAFLDLSGNPLIKLSGLARKE